MQRFVCVLILLLWGFGVAQAQEAIPRDTLAAIKHATVFIQVQGADWQANGSGFVVQAEKEQLLIATNYHVVAMPDLRYRPKLMPRDLAESLKKASVTVVFDGGTKTEQSAKAEVVAADPAVDLAVLRVTGVKMPPSAIDSAHSPDPSETMPVYMFGYPFGEALATTPGSPAITVAKGYVSSLRLDDEGNLRSVQIDGNLNPGNSGGPVVDAKGRLIGIAVSIMRNGRGIGFAIPTAKLNHLMKGRLGTFHMTAHPAEGKLVVRAEIAVLDPSAAQKSVNLFYLHVPPGKPKPILKEPLTKNPAAKKLVLSSDGWAAIGEIRLEEPIGELFLQAEFEDTAKHLCVTKIRNYNLAPSREDALGAAPKDWKSYRPADKSYAIWVPEKNRGLIERERTDAIGFQPLKFRRTVIDTDGPLFAIEEMNTPQMLARQLTRDDFEELIVASALRELGVFARLTDVENVTAGKLVGREYRLELGRFQTRLRVFVTPTHLYAVRAIGTRAVVDSVDADTFLKSFRANESPDAVPPTVRP